MINLISDDNKRIVKIIDFFNSYLTKKEMSDIKKDKNNSITKYLDESNVIKEEIVYSWEPGETNLYTIQTSVFEKNFIFEDKPLWMLNSIDEIVYSQKTGKRRAFRISESHWDKTMKEPLVKYF